MSGYGDLFDKPTITAYDNVASADSVQDLADATEVSFDKVQDVIGNLHGLTTEAKEVKSTSIAAELGDIQGFSPEKPFNIEFADYVETFNNPGYKEFNLALMPTFSVEPIITSTSDIGITWNRVSSLSDLEAIGDYTIIGRSLFFYKQPTDQFTITYTGIYTQHQGGLPDGYLPNVYPSPELIDDQGNSPVVTQINPTRYNVEFTQSNINNYLEEFGSTLELAFNTVLQPYVSNTSYIAAPSDMVAIWWKDSSADYFSKLDTSAIYLKSPTELEFVTSDTNYDYANSQVILVLANISISDHLKALSNLVLQHNHDRYGSTQTVSHESLSGLIPVSENEDIIYGGSAILGNDHPQYLHREGFKLDTGTYNNAMLGDILVGSTSPDSLYNNILSDSNRIVFGSVSDGPSIKYSFTYQGLQLTGVQNGLKIQSAQTGVNGKESNILTLNDHNIFNWRAAGIDYLSIGSVNSKVRFSNNLGTTLADVELGALTSVDQNISGNVTYGATGSYTIGTIQFSQTDLSGNTGILVSQTTDSNAFVNFTAPASFADSTHTLLTANDANITGSLDVYTNARIGFGSTPLQQAATSLTYKILSETINSVATEEESIVINNKNPVRFASSGRRTGIAFGPNTNPFSDEYANLYTSTPAGDPSNPSNSDTYMELNRGKMYFLKTTNQNHVLNDRVYKWKSGTISERIDSLYLWPKADIVGGAGDFYNITLMPSTTAEKKGVSFGNGNTIYVTGTASNCPSGKMVLESQNGVVFVDASSEVVDCNNLSYSEITTGNMQAFGSIIASTDISAGNNIRATGRLAGASLEITGESILNGAVRIRAPLRLESDLESLAGATFNTNLDVKGSIDVGNVLRANALRVSGSAIFDDITKMNSTLICESDAIIKNELQVNGEVTIKNTANIDNIVSNEAKISILEVSSELNVKTSASIGGNVDIEGNLSVAQAITSDFGFFTDGSITGDSLNIAKSSVFGDTATFNSSITTNGDLFLNNSTSKLVVIGQSQFLGQASTNDLTINGNNSVAGTFTAKSFASFQSAIDVNGVAEFNSSINVGEAINGQYLTIESTATIKGFLIVEDKIQGTSADFTGNLRVDGTLTTGSIVISDGISTGFASDSSLGNLEVSGDFEQTSATANFTVSGHGRFSNDVRFEAPVTFSSISIGSTNLVVITDNNIAIGPVSNRGSLFAGSITSSGITNTGNITTGSLVAGTANIGSLTASGNISASAGINLGGSKITNSSNPVDPGDLVNKAYADSIGAGAPIGATFMWLSPVIPTGYLEANGFAVSRTTYAALFNLIGTLYGNGDGSTTFNLPDTRGMFIRGFDNGRGIDPGRAIGTTQQDSVKYHKHLQPGAGETPGQDSNGPFGRTANANHGGHRNYDYDNFLYYSNDGSNDGDWLDLNPAGVMGDENRPKNISLMYIIKAL